jgi:hypothetical protein
MSIAAEAISPYPSSVGRPLRKLATDLANTRESIESAFVDVGNGLGKCATLLNRIAGIFESLPQDLASQELTEATIRLSAMGKRAQELAASFTLEQSDVANLVAVVAAAGHPISDLRRAVKMMGIVAVNARVVAATVVGEADDFDVFTSDIAALSDRAAATIHEFSLIYEQLHIEVHKAAEQREHFEEAHSETLSGLASRLERSLAEVTERRRASLGDSAETGRVSRRIASGIASVVMAMQVGDATRQRIEHVEAALSALTSLLDGPAAPPPSVTDSVSADVRRLLAAQLSGTGKSFDVEVAEAEASLQNLAIDAQTIMTHSQSTYGNGASEDQSPLAALSAEVHRAITVLRSCELERQKLERVSSAVQATVKILLEHVEGVQEIESSMRLVSLNAAVKCAQLGPRGHALNVIARELRQLTGVTVEAAQAATHSLGQAVTLAQSFRASSGGDATGQVSWLEQEASAAVVPLEAVEKRLNDALHMLTHDGPIAIGLLGQAVSRFSSHAGISEAISDVQIQLEPDTDHGAGTGRESRAILRQIRKAYTMDAERRIHTDIVGDDEEDDADAPTPELADLFL